MKNYLLKNYFFAVIREYIFIFLTATIFLITFSTKGLGEENVFTIDNIKIKGELDLNFSRDKYLKIAFIDSFNILMQKILLSRDLKKVKNTKLNQIEKLINNFQIIEEKYMKNEYEIDLRVIFNEIKVKKYLSKKNISFSQPENITSVFFPILFIDGKFKNFNENYFYKNWNKIKIKNEVINFILPLEDLDDVSEIIKMKDKIEDLEVESLVNKYNIENYVFTLIEYQEKKMNIHIKTNFNNNIINKNASYNLNNIKDKKMLEIILKDLKFTITDIWKEENLVNLLLPLSIQFKFQHTHKEDLNKLRKTLNKIKTIDKHILEKFNINDSFFKVYYYGNPKKLKLELLKHNYKLKNNQGFWQLYLNE